MNDLQTQVTQENHHAARIRFRKKKRPPYHRALANPTDSTAPWELWSGHSSAAWVKPTSRLSHRNVTRDDRHTDTQTWKLEQNTKGVFTSDFQDKAKQKVLNMEQTAQVVFETIFRILGNERCRFVFRFVLRVALQFVWSRYQSASRHALKSWHVLKFCHLLQACCQQVRQAVMNSR